MSAQITWSESQPAGKPFTVRDFWVAVLEPLASLKLTVVLFGLSLFIILAGTLAQVDKDIWEVIRIYFRAPIAWIEPHIFFPPSFFPESMRPQFPVWLRIPFPGGWMIGAVMALNLVAAHFVRFQVQARGPKLFLGSAVIFAGMLLTFLVVQSGTNRNGLQEQPLISYDSLWKLFQVGLVIGWLALIWGTVTAFQAARKSGWGWLTGAVIGGAFLTWLFLQGDAARLNDSAMRILWQLSKGSIAGIVLLIGCGIVFGKRAGIVLIHGGVGLMMFGELFVGLMAVEGQMRIKEGQASHYVQDIRTWELAIIDPTDPHEDRVVVVPKGAVLAAYNRKQPITNPKLPFRIDVLQFFPNATIKDVKPDESNPATQGVGKTMKAQEAPPVSGTDSSGMIDQTAAYLKLTSVDGQHDYGTYLAGVMFSMLDFQDEVAVNDKKYRLSMRFKRTYKPYSLELKDFKKEDYVGTSTPRNFQSDVVLKDPTRNVERDVKIWMNNPLRFAGETFYQSSFFQDPATGKEGTVLSVVTNTGWLIPYVSCMIVAIGMLAHFTMTLSRFLNRMDRSSGDRELANGSEELSADPRRRAAKKASPANPAPSSLGIAGWLLPLSVVTLAAVGVGMQTKSPKAPEGGFDLYRFGQLPVLADGRAKPVDTLARHSMLAISGKQTWVDENEQRQPAVKWFLDMMVTPKVGAEERVIRIENLEVQELLGLERREGFRYSMNEVFDREHDFQHFNAFLEEAEKASAIPGTDQSAYQRKLLELKHKIDVIHGLLNAFTQPPIEGEGQELAMSVINQMQRQKAIKQTHPPLAIPPMESDEAWETYASGWLWNFVKEAVTKQTKNPYSESWDRIFAAYEKREAGTFNSEVAQLQQRYEEKPLNEVNPSKVEFESYFNRSQPMTLAMGLYVTAFVIAAIGWLCLAFDWRVGYRLAGRTAFWLTVFTLIVHTLAVASRMYISGRPPVTNLYSSAVFIGWGCVVLGLILEVVFRLGLGIIISTVAGFSTLLIAWGLESDGSDTFSVMQAVLDTQFWLATHVTCITLGYATTYLAGLIGTAYILLGVITPKLTPQLAKDLTRMNYGTLCFSIFFSFVGTVLGGLWADDSWGRFWGWDPKENGALMIVLWNALILHARWGGLVRERGLAVLAVIGNIIVSWSWFGVNALSVGLHTYGFDSRIFTLFCTLSLAHLPLIALGLLPRHIWWSRNNGGETLPPLSA